MRRLSLKAGARLAAVAAASTSLLTLGGGVQSIPVAHADPLSSHALVGVGSDTIQDLFNAFAGAAPVASSTTAPKGFTPLVSSVGTKSVGVVSWDAIDPQNPTTSFCIVPKANEPQIDRPNGSADGQKALSRSIDGGAWTKSEGCGSALGNVSGAIDFARSSAGPSSSFPGTVLSFIPFARDGVSYAFFDHGNGDAVNLTTANLHTLYGTGGVPTGGTLTLGNGDVIHACMVQAGSGTGKFWDKAMGNAGDGATSTASAVASGCNAAGVLPPTGYEENGYNSWVTSTYVAGLAAGQDAIIPFSGGQWIAQANGAGVDRSSMGRGVTETGQTGLVDALGAITDGATALGTPNIINATPPPAESPNATFYASTTYGRDLFVVVPTSQLAVGANPALASLFKGAGSAICSAAAQTTIKAFGFSFPPVDHACGTNGVAALQSGLVS
jgi:hypothetical protein